MKFRDLLPLLQAETVEIYLSGSDSPINVTNIDVFGSNSDIATITSLNSVLGDYVVCGVMSATEHGGSLRVDLIPKSYNAPIPVLDEFAKILKEKD